MKKKTTYLYLLLCILLGSLAIFAIKQSGQGMRIGQNASFDECQYSDTPESANCIDCELTLFCLSPDRNGLIHEYPALDTAGQLITQIPTTTCGQEGYWSCPGITSQLTLSPGPDFPIISLLPQKCPASIKDTTRLTWPTFMIVKNKKAFDQLAVAACERGAANQTHLNLLPAYEYGLKSKYDWSVAGDQCRCGGNEKCPPEFPDCKKMCPPPLEFCRGMCNLPGKPCDWNQKAGEQDCTTDGKYSGCLDDKDNQFVPRWSDNTLHRVISTNKEPKGDLPFNRLIAFGDSISDTANRYTYVNFPTEFFHRYSNGPLWIEHIARKFQHTRNEIELLDIAYAGAAVNPKLGDSYLSLVQQVKFAIQLLEPQNQPIGSNITPQFTIFSMMAGMIDMRDVIEDFWNKADPSANRDYYYWDRLQKCWDEGEFPGYNADSTALAKQCVHKTLFDDSNSIKAAVVKLITAGAHYFIIPEFPDFTLLPRYNGITFQGKEKPPIEKVKMFIKILSFEFNEELKQLISDLETQYSNQSVKIIRLDLYNMYNQLADTNSNLAKKAGITFVKEPGAGRMEVDPASVLYWDDVHPSETANCVIGERAYELMYEKFGKTYNPDYGSCHHSYIKYGGSQSASWMSYKAWP